MGWLANLRHWLQEHKLQNKSTLDCLEQKKVINFVFKKQETSRVSNCNPCIFRYRRFSVCLRHQSNGRNYQITSSYKQDNLWQQWSATLSFQIQTKLSLWAAVKFIKEQIQYQDCDQHEWSFHRNGNICMLNWNLTRSQPSNRAMLLSGGIHKNSFWRLYVAIQLKSFAFCSEIPRIYVMSDI